MAQGVNEECLKTAMDPTLRFYDLPKEESLFEIIGVPNLLLSAFGGVALVFVYMWARAKKDQIACPHCGAKWWASSVQGGAFGSYWTEFFCYSCQRYWT